MSATRPDHRRHQSPFLRDLSSPVSSSFRMPPASLRREAQASTPPPPPPLLSLDDLSRHPPSPPPYTPPQATGTPSPPPARGGLFSTPQRSNGSPAPAAWWSASREEKAREGSPVDGVVHQQQSPPTASVQQQQQLQVALITLPPPREVARPEMPRDSVLSTGRVDEEEWVTVFGFLPGDTNLVLREFEKCGIVLRHVPGPRDANWMHILYQSMIIKSIRHCVITEAARQLLINRRSGHPNSVKDKLNLSGCGVQPHLPRSHELTQSRRDAQKALAKHGQQLNSVLIIGVKQVDPWQRPYLNDNTDENYQGSVSVPFSSQPVAPSGFATRNALAPLPSNAMQNGSCNESGRGATGAIASPAKSVLSKVMDLMFGL